MKIRQFRGRWSEALSALSISLGRSHANRAEQSIFCIVDTSNEFWFDVPSWRHGIRYTNAERDDSEAEKRQRDEQHCYSRVALRQP